jgi:hypothetical protein
MPTTGARLISQTPVRDTAARTPRACYRMPSHSAPRVAGSTPATGDLESRDTRGEPQQPGGVATHHVAEVVHPKGEPADPRQPGSAGPQLAAPRSVCCGDGSRESRVRGRACRRSPANPSRGRSESSSRNHGGRRLHRVAAGGGSRDLCLTTWLRRRKKHKSWWDGLPHGSIALAASGFTPAPPSPTGLSSACSAPAPPPPRAPGAWHHRPRGG